MKLIIMRCKHVDAAASPSGINATGDKCNNNKNKIPVLGSLNLNHKSCFRLLGNTQQSILGSDYDIGRFSISQAVRCVFLLTLP